MPHSVKPADVEILFASKLNNHRVAVVVPAGCHVEGQDTGIEVGQDIYTFFVSPGIKLHGRKK
jgi:hypothetical protein